MQIREITDAEEASRALGDLSQEPFLVVDLETTGLNPRKDKILDITIATETQAIVMPWSTYAVTSGIIKGMHLVFHNFKFDCAMLHYSGVDILKHHTLTDTMLSHHLLDENSSHALDSLIQVNYNDKYKEEFWAKHDTYESASREEQVAYTGKDGIYTAKLHKQFTLELEKQDLLALRSHVHRLAYTLFKTEIEGLPIDRDYTMSMGVTLQGQIASALVEARALVDTECRAIETQTWLTEMEKRKTPKGKDAVPRPEFSFESNKQLQSLLYSELRLPVQYNEKTKKPTTDDAALAVLEPEHPVIPVLRRFRDANKIYTTYIDGILQREEGGRIYPSFNVNGTTTGRISHSAPNMGNMPREGGIRGIFVASPGHKIISADYSSLEVVIAAHFSRDPNLLKIVLEGASQHDITAEALQIPRQVAKTLNFAMQYRCSSNKVASILGCTQKESIYAYNKYWETYSELRKLMAACDAKIDAGEPIVTLYGRKRRFPVMKRQLWDKAYRQGFNALIQGSGGDLTNEATYLVGEKLRTKGMGRVLFSVHDEILIEAKNEFVGEAQAMLRSGMQDVGVTRGLTVPLKAEVQQPADRWED